ncbi:hypothetical protein HNP38_002125 [Chryseobacterium defluvii]|uniref:Uncharacterized protein n=1 Tax=Chryseobacterium defluvii TaxID=160396 RepID=A0A840KBL7_9FLAO|nr:hypothetical protein [Chryseobacterium defluvii]
MKLETVKKHACFFGALQNNTDSLEKLCIYLE